MSNRLNPNQAPDRGDNPVQQYLRWNGADGRPEYYDKETNTNKPMPMPLTLVILEERGCVKGYDQKLNTGINSTEIPLSEFKNKPIKVYAGGTKIAEGIYKEIKEDLKDCKFHLSIYAMTEKGTIVNIKLKGAAFMAYSSVKDRFDGALKIVSRSEEKKKGSIRYYEPVFEKVTITPAVEQLAIDATNKVLAYHGHDVAVDDSEEEEENNLPFDNVEEVEDAPF